jgi:signal transduction histidine kinase
MYKFADVILQAGGAGGSLLDAIAAPIAAAQAAIEKLKTHALPASAAGFLEDLSEANASAMALLGVARDLQRAELGLLQRTLESRRLREVMDEVEERWRRQASHHGAGLLTSYDGEPECVARVDWRGLQQIFDALIAHAMAKTSGGVVEASLTARQDKRNVTIECRVRDNGASAGSDYLVRLLAAEASAEEVGGLNVLLSLALANQAIKAMNGELVAQANAGADATLGFTAVCEAAELDVADGEARMSWSSTTTPLIAWSSRPCARCSTAPPSRSSTASRRSRPRESAGSMSS